VPGRLDLRKGTGGHAAPRRTAGRAGYLRPSGEALPNLVAGLNGSVCIDVVGRIDAHHGGMRAIYNVPTPR
jgi:hypothetical protein